MNNAVTNAYFALEQVRIHDQKIHALKEQLRSFEQQSEPMDIRASVYIERKDTISFMFSSAAAPDIVRAIKNALENKLFEEKAKRAGAMICYKEHAAQIKE